MGINRSYSIPLSGGLGYQSNTDTHAQKHPSAYDHALRRSQDSVHTGISDVNRSTHDSVHSGHGHGHGEIERGGEDDNDNYNDAGSEKCESMSLDFGHNMENMSIDDGTCARTLSPHTFFYNFRLQCLTPALTLLLFSKKVSMMTNQSPRSLLPLVVVTQKTFLITIKNSSEIYD